MNNSKPTMQGPMMIAVRDQLGATATQTATQISTRENKQADGPAARAEARLDEARSTLSLIETSPDDPKAKALARTGDAALTALDDLTEAVASAVADDAKARARALAVFDTMRLEAGTMAQARAEASRSAGQESFAASRPALDAALAEAAKACARFELESELADATSDADLAEAMAGRITAEDQASTDVISSWIASAPMKASIRVYDLMVRAGSPPDEVARFERAALKACADRSSAEDAALMRYTGGRGRDLIPRERDGAQSLRQAIDRERAKRVPASVGLARTLLAQLSDAFRLVAGVDRSEVDATGQSTEGAIREAATLGRWTATKSWASRYGLGR